LDWLQFSEGHQRKINTKGASGSPKTIKEKKLFVCNYPGLSFKMGYRLLVIPNPNRTSPLKRTRKPSL
jgi:hypothetical protein